MAAEDALVRAADAATTADAGGTPEEPYIAFDLRTLRVDSTLSFNRYIRFDDDYVLYRHADRAFDERTFTSLIDNGVDTLYVTRQAQRQLARYYELHLPMILADKAVPVAERSRAVLQVAGNLARDIINTPDGRVARRAVRLVEELASFVSDAPNALARLMQMLGDGSTLEEHSANTAILALVLSGSRRDATVDSLGEVAAAALMHDVGLSVVGAQILQKPGPLDANERVLVEQHPVTGEQMLRQVGGFSDDVLAVVRGHHERLDGSGYPDGLTGDGVPWMARVLAIAEVFESLTSTQPYRERLQPLDALTFMLREMEDQFDSTLLRQFIPALIEQDDQTDG